MSSNQAHLFRSSEIADGYIKHRPTYTSDVYETIMNFCMENALTAKISLALDVGCGSGQSTVPLTKHFQRVIGLDVSEAQISRAPTDIANLTFTVGSAEDLSFLDGGSVDLVTVATALHWMDMERFYAEVERVLRPGGALVAYIHGFLRLDEPAAQETVFYFYKDVLGPYWTDGIKHLEQEYRSISLPFPGWRRDDGLHTVQYLTVDELVGYLSTWSAYHQYIAHNNDGSNSSVLEDIKRRLQAVYQAKEGGDGKVRVTWPVFMLMGRKPGI
ncbi:hypothetical protein ACOMHN_031022 [Nucella lapillus]